MRKRFFGKTAVRKYSIGDGLRFCSINFVAVGECLAVLTEALRDVLSMVCRSPNMDSMMCIFWKPAVEKNYRWCQAPHALLGARPGGLF